MLKRARRALVLALTGSLAALLAVTPAAAQKQSVVIYTAIENEQIAEYKKAYEKALPNLDVKMLRLSTGDIAARFMAEKDNMQADLIWGVGATNMLQFKNAGLLEPYAPKGLERIQPLFRDKANPPAWVGLDIYMSAFCFNTEVGKKHTLPRPESWADLTKPVYKGHVVMPNPASSGTGYLSVVSVLQRMGEAEGWKYLEALDQNVAYYTRGGGGPAQLVARGEAILGVATDEDALPLLKKQAPVQIGAPVEGIGAIGQWIAIPKGSKAPDAAKKMIDLAGTPEFQEFLATYGNLAAREVKSPLYPTRPKLIPIDWKLYGQKEVRAKIIGTWRDKFGHKARTQ